jgi:uncharacterized protein DUF6064
MSEWWTYTLSDFLLFSSRTYYRLFEIYNAAIWPAQLAAVALGVAIVVLLRRRTAGASRATATLLAAAWLWVALAFFAARYATINWAAVYFAWAFGLEAVLLIWFGALRGRLTVDRRAGLESRIGFALFLFALFLQPIASPLLGRGWKSIAVFGATPDPTAVATLGVLLLSSGRGRGFSMVVPVLWCAISGLTLLAMKSPDWWVLPVAAILTIGVAAGAALSRRRAKSGFLD